MIQSAGPQLPCEILNTPLFRGGLSLLLNASHYAAATQSDPWDFAVELRHLRRAGFSENDLRFLVRLKLIDLAREVTSCCDQRRFERSDELSFVGRTCFVLTPTGVDVATQITCGKFATGNSAILSNGNRGVAFQKPSPVVTPYWDSECRVLWFDQSIVKHFKWQAANQERILAAFQEENWPPKILDPLAPQQSQVMKRRLSDTIKCLNRGQQNRLVRFRGDGSGEGILWETDAPLCGSL